MPNLINAFRPLPAAWLLAVCFLSSSGCSDGTEKTVSVTGKVTRNGQPVAGITVSFVPQAETSTGVSTGKTNNDGTYELRVSKTGRRGAVVGTHKVWVSLPPQPRAVRKAKREGREENIPPPQGETNLTSADAEAIVMKYGNLNTTPLKVEVTGGQAIDLQLD
jgi:hypothetical protein